MQKIVLWFCLSFVTSNVIGVSDILTEEISCLTDLPMSQLLKIKRSIEKLSCASNENPSLELESRSRDSPVQDKYQNNLSPLPLVSDDASARSYNELEDHGEPSKIQTVFQLSITALSFLAFGGYLLCMIVHAIKSKGTTYFHSLGGSLTSNANSVSPLKKIKVYRRSKRMAKTKNGTSEIKIEDQLAGPSPEEIYKVLVAAAEGYVRIVGI